MHHLISEPDIFIYDLNKENFDFIFLGCDGIYDIFSSKELVDKIWEYCRHFKSLLEKNRESFYQSVLNSILHSTMVQGGYDNLTGIWIPFQI